MPICHTYMLLISHECNSRETKKTAVNPYQKRLTLQEYIL